MKSLDELGELQLYSRDIAPRITLWLKEREAIVISGGRRTGKTSLMYLPGRQMPARQTCSTWKFPRIATSPWLGLTRWSR